MIMVRPSRNGSPCVTPRHMIAPFQIGGPSFGIELRAHRGMNAVGADQQRALRVVAIGSPVRRSTKCARTPVRSSLPAGQMMAGENAVGAQPLARRVEQDHLQFAAMDGELRPVVAGGRPRGSRPDALAAAWSNTPVRAVANAVAASRRQGRVRSVRAPRAAGC